MLLHFKSRYLFFLFSILFFSSTTVAERYRVTEGSFGQTDAVSVKKEASKSIKDDRALASDPDVKIDESTIDMSNTDAEEELKGDRSSSEDDLDHIQVNEAEAKEEVRSIGVFEQKYLEAEFKERSAVVQKLLNNRGNNPVDATEVNASEFVDADDLEAGKVPTDPSQSPYFIQVDAQGRVTTQAYDPNLEKAFAESQRNKKYDFTQATVYTRDQESPENSLLKQADPVAKSILFGKSAAAKSYFESFSESCCETLLFDKRNSLEKGLSYFFELNEDDLSYRFKEGDSRYVLLKLPLQSGKNYPLRLRTFIREFKDKAIRHGVFFPQLITLNKDKQPLRIITGPLLKYFPENWMKYGYLEGVFDIDQTKDQEEVYLLINTSRKITKEASLIELNGKTITIEHMNQGSLEIEIISG